MNKNQLVGIGVFLGTMLIILAILQFIATWEAGKPNYYMIVMTFGMILMIYYSIVTGRNRRRRR